MKLLTGTGMASEKNHQWKGDDASYEAKHDWVYRRLGKASVCQKCGESKKRIGWANKSHKYFRIESDWIALCMPCHREYDGHTKFTREQAYKIKKEYLDGEIFQHQLATKYSVSRCVIQNVIAGKIKSYA